MGVKHAAGGNGHVVEGRRGDSVVYAANRAGAAATGDPTPLILYAEDTRGGNGVDSLQRQHHAALLRQPLPPSTAGGSTIDSRGGGGGGDISKHAPPASSKGDAVWAFVLRGGYVRRVIRAYYAPFLMAPVVRLAGGSKCDVLVVFSPSFHLTVYILPNHCHPCACV